MISSLLPIDELSSQADNLRVERRQIVRDMQPSCAVHGLQVHIKCWHHNAFAYTVQMLRQPRRATHRAAQGPLLGQKPAAMTTREAVQRIVLPTFISSPHLLRHCLTLCSVEARRPGRGQQSQASGGGKAVKQVSEGWTWQMLVLTRLH